MAENKQNPIDMDVTVTYHISSIEALAKDIAAALLVFVDLKSDVERKIFVNSLFSGLYKKPSEEAPSEETAKVEEAPADETAEAEENDHPYMVNVFEDAKKRQ